MNFPDDSQRLAIIGATGSGKTVAALWHLSHRSFDQMPWVVYDFKADPGIAGIPGAFPLALDRIPVEPGIYVARPLPDQLEAVSAQLAAIWGRGFTGVYVDEGYMMSTHNEKFRALLSQGRSKTIPMIVLSQRPVWLDRYILSESEYYQVFRLQHSDDIKAVEKIIPAEIERLPAYHSYYYDSLNDDLRVLRPVPPLDTIYRTFRLRLQPQRMVI